MMDDDATREEKNVRDQGKYKLLECVCCVCGCERVMRKIKTTTREEERKGRIEWWSNDQEWLIISMRRCGRLLQLVTVGGYYFSVVGVHDKIWRGGNSSY